MRETWWRGWGTCSYIGTMSYSWLLKPLPGVQCVGAQRENQRRAKSNKKARRVAALFFFRALFSALRLN